MKRAARIALIAALLAAARSPATFALRASAPKERLALLSAEGDVRAFSAPVAGARAFQASVTYARDVAPLIADRCAMCHHPGGSAPFSLLAYDEVKRH